MEDKSRPAIDWDQPIQTPTGERAEVIGEREVERFPSSGAPIRQQVKLVCVYHGDAPEAFGDIYQVSLAGYRLDAQTPELLEKAPFIRNVPKKIEGWAVLNWHEDRAERGILNGTIFSTEDVARRARVDAADRFAPPRHYKVVRVEMTEV